MGITTATTPETLHLQDVEQLCNNLTQCQNKEV
jgi:hypothetical protein